MKLVLTKAELTSAINNYFRLSNTTEVVIDYGSVESDPDATKEIVVGALYSLMASLTTRGEPVTFGTGIESHQAVKIIQEFLEYHGLDDVDADVENWQHRI
jgi:hypothetical protein